MRVLVVIPSDRIKDYEQKGITWLEGYFNPSKYFDKVYLLSPLENHEQYLHGLIIIPTKSGHNFKGLIKEIKPDIIRAYGGYWASDFAVLNRIRNIPLLISVHDTNPDLIHLSLKHATHIICMTTAVKEAVINKTGISNSKIDVLGNRIDTNLFKRDSAIDQAKLIREQFPDGKMILHIGRKSKQKNQGTLIRALNSLPDDHFCVFIGQGDDRPYKELAEVSGVTSRCFWIESVENSDLPKWYNACDLFCVLSRWEGFGLVFIEAAACETLILTSDIAPMNEILDENSCFFIKDYENPIKVAEKITSIFSINEYHLNSIKGNARQKSLEFDVEKIANKEIEIYRKVMQRREYNDFLDYNIWKSKHLLTKGYSNSKRMLKKILRRFLV